MSLPDFQSYVRAEGERGLGVSGRDWEPVDQGVTQTSAHGKERVHSYSCQH